MKPSAHVPNSYSFQVAAELLRGAAIALAARQPKLAKAFAADAVILLCDSDSSEVVFTWPGRWP